MLQALLLVWEMAPSTLWWVYLKTCSAVGLSTTPIEGLFEDYAAPNKIVNHVTVDHEVPLTFWRAVGHSYTAIREGIHDG